MVPAEGDAAPAAASTGARRGRRQRGWAAVLCLGSRGARGEDASLGSTSRARMKRTVPVDGEVVPPPAGCDAGRGGGADAEKEEAAKGRKRARGCCCFLPPPGVSSGRRDNTMESSGGRSNMTGSSNRPGQAREVHQACVAPVTTGTGSTGAAEVRAPTPRLSATLRDAETKDQAPARRCCTKASGGVAGAFGHAVGLCVVAAVSMAGLLGGRLWAMAFVCAWLVALSRLHQRRGAQVSAGGIT